VIWFSALWHLLGVLTEVGSAGLLAGTAAAAGLLLAAALAVRVLRRARVAAAAPRLALPSAPTVVPRHRDPDARGHSRPRAPTAALAAALRTSS
jgi:hypothetical protein